MSDFMFMLDSHLTTGQNRAVAEIQAIATASSMSVWLAGGAMRDMLRGAPIRDLDFVVERDAVKVAKTLAANLNGVVLSEDPLKRFAELLLSGDTRVSVANSRTEKYSKAGAKPQIAPATIHEDLQRRDFTINAIALSLNRGGRGLLVDPVNGQADLLNSELRATNSYIFYDDPSRLIRLIRFKHALGFQPAPRTKLQFENALLENMQNHVPAAVIAKEIRTMANDPGIVPMLEELDSHGLLAPLSKGLTGAKLNVLGLDRLEKLMQSVMPPGSSGGFLTFLNVLIEKLNAKERAETLAAFELTAAEAADMKKLDARAKKLEAALKSARLTRPSSLWDILHDATTDDIMTLLMHSTARPVQERVRLWFDKYLPIAMEVTEEEILATGAKPGTPKYEKARTSLIAARLNAKPKKEESDAEPEPEPMKPPIVASRGRG